MSDDDFTLTELEATEHGSAAAGGAEAGRIIRPAPGDGVLLDDRSFQLEDVTELAETLSQHAQGRLARLRQTADAVESRLRQRIAESHDCIQRAFARADELVQQRLEETRLRSREILEERYREGHELGRREGFHKGYEEGLARGLDEGRESGRAEGQERFSAEVHETGVAIGSLCEQLEQRWRAVYADAHRDIVELALDIARDVILVEVQQVPEIIEEKLRTALDRLAAEERLTVEIHPEDRDIARRYLDGLMERVEGSALVDVTTRDDIGRGGCRVVGATSSVDLTLETQLDVITRRLQQAAGDPA